LSQQATLLCPRCQQPYGSIGSRMTQIVTPLASAAAPQQNHGAPSMPHKHPEWGITATLPTFSSWRKRKRTISRGAAEQRRKAVLCCSASLRAPAAACGNDKRPLITRIRGRLSITGRRRRTLPPGGPGSTIRAAGFHFRVRDGIGWIPRAIATGHKGPGVGSGREEARSSAFDSKIRTCMCCRLVLSP
jgi:hypothetical protein